MIKILCLAALFSSILNGEEIDRIFIIANNDVVTYNEFSEMFDSLKNEYQKFNQPLPKGLKSDLINRLISNKLISQKAGEKGIDIGESEITEAIENFKQMNRLTDNMFKEELKREGKTLKEFREEYKVQLRNQRFIDIEVRSKIKEPSKAEVTKYYNSHQKEMMLPERVSLYHIQMTENPDLSLSERLKVKSDLDNIRSRAIKGEDFSKLAMKYSDDPMSAQNGGKLGEFPRGQLSPEMEQLVFSMKKGEISPPIKSGNAYHIFMVKEKLRSKKMSLGEAEEQIKRALLSDKIQVEVQVWVEKTMEASYLEIVGPKSSFIFKNKKWREKNGSKEYSTEEFFRTIN